MTHKASRMQVLKIGERRASLLLLAQEKSRGLLLCEGFKERATARTSHPKMGDTSGLLASQSREHVSIAISLDTWDGIVVTP